MSANNGNNGNRLIRPQTIQPGRKEDMLTFLRSSYLYLLGGNEIYLVHPPQNFPTRYCNMPTVRDVLRVLGRSTIHDTYPLARINREEVYYDPTIAHNQAFLTGQRALARDLSDYVIAEDGEVQDK